VSEWTWAFGPEHIGDGLPTDVRAEIERIAADLTFLEADSDAAGGPEGAAAASAKPLLPTVAASSNTWSPPTAMRS